jgi:hypothetical protein
MVHTICTAEVWHMVESETDLKKICITCFISVSVHGDNNNFKIKIVLHVRVRVRVLSRKK